MELRQSTTQVIRFGPFPDSTDGITPETGLTITQSDMQLSKDGGSFAQKSAAGNAVHDVDGYYFTTLSTTDSNTTANLKLQVTVAGALPFWVDFDVVTQTYYDAKYSGTFNNLGGAAQTSDHTNSVAAILLDTGTTLDAKLNNIQGTTFSTSTDSLEAIRNRGDAEWTTGAGGSSPTVVQIRQEMDSNSTKLIDIAADTADLQANQGGWLTATGFNVGKTGYTLTTQDWNTTTPLSASGIRSAVGLSSANMDAQFTASATATGFATSSAQSTMQTDINAILVDTGTTIPTQIAGLNNLSINDVFTTQLTESYAVDGVSPTLTQAIMLTMQTVSDFSINATTITTKKLDGSTVAATHTLDDGVNPTSRTRTS